MVRATIYLVDDDPFLTQALARTLTAQGANVFTFGTLADAWAGLQSQIPDVLVLDLNLPDGDGMDLCRRIRSRWSFPVLMLSARSESMDKVTGLDVGADDYLTKPFDPHELIARIRALLRRSRQSATVGDAPTLSAGKIVLEPRNREARVGETVLVLTTIEFDLLAYLVEHVNQVVQRQQVFQAVWGYSSDFGSNTLDVLIYRLRSKLRAAGAGDPIATVRGHGFRLRVEAAERS